MNRVAAIPRLENKLMPASRLARFFDTKSIEELCNLLQQLADEDYFKLEITLSSEYFEWQITHRNLIFAKDDSLVPDDDYAYWARRDKDTYGLSIDSAKPLTDDDLSEVMQKLPVSLSNQYLRFKLLNIDLEKLTKLIVMQQKGHGINEDEFYDRVEYNGLIVDGVEVTFNDQSVETNFQHRQALRLLMKKKGKLCYKDEFTHAEAGIFNRSTSLVKDHTLRNLVYEVREALRTVTKQDHIKSTPGEGWSLKIEP